MAQRETGAAPLGEDRRGSDGPIKGDVAVADRPLHPEHRRVLARRHREDLSNAALMTLLRFPQSLDRERADVGWSIDLAMASATEQQQVLGLVPQLDGEVMLSPRRSGARGAADDVGAFAQIDRLLSELRREQLAVAESAAATASNKQLTGYWLRHHALSILARGCDTEPTTMLTRVHDTADAVPAARAPRTGRRMATSDLHDGWRATDGPVRRSLVKRLVRGAVVGWFRRATCGEENGQCSTSAAG